jgi:hypothetical protein
MVQFSSNLYKQLNEDLISLSTEQQLVPRLEKMVETCVSYFEQLKAFFKENPPINQQEEVRFFKYIKPRFFSQIIYHLKVYNLESRRPVGSYEMIKVYLSEELSNIHSFYQQHLELYQYYRTGKSYLDEFYFVRGKQKLNLILDSYFFDTDPEFTTSHDYKISRIMANERLLEYINESLERLENGEVPPAAKPVEISQALTWSAGKTNLIELAYALQTAGCYNNGNADLKLIIDQFEKTYSIQLGNAYRTYLELRSRKKSRTQFLDQLREKLTERMDNADEPEG